MTERTRKIIIFSTLPLAIIWAVYNLGGDKKTRPATPPPTIAPVSPASAARMAKPAPSQESLANLQSADWGSDPFRARVRTRSNSGQAKPAERSWKLSGILYSEDNPVAIINGRPARIGQDIEGAKVLEIDRDKVVLDNRGSRKTLTISKG